MTEERRNGIIEDLVRKLGVKGTYQGLRCLVWGVSLVYDDGQLLMAVTKELYPEIGHRVGRDGRAVERNLRTVTQACWEQGDREFLNEIAGITLRARPTNGELIDYLVHYIRCRGLLEDAG